MPSNLIEREFSKQLSQVHAPELLESDVDPLPNGNTRPAAKTRLSWLRLGLLCIGLFGSFALGWWLATHQSQQHERISLPPSDMIIDSDKFIVTSTSVRYRPVERLVEAVGTLHAFEEVTLSAKQEGRVLKIHHDLSSVVKPGEILLELDPTDAKLAYDQAERAVQTELAKWGFKDVPTESEDLQKLPTVVSARLKAELAQSRLQRMILLKATNAVSAEDLEQAKSDTLVQESEWQNQLLTANSAAATARLRNAELAIANQRLQDISIRAPIPSATTNANDGFYTISERLVSEGTLVRSGTDVFTLVMGRTLKLKLSVPESYNGQVRVGQSVSITTGASETPSKGTVARISPVIDRSTRTFLVEVDVPNEALALKPGGFAKAKILIGSEDRATTIPLSGLYSFAGINKVFVDENGIAREIKVTLGEQTREWVEITSPKLAENASVVTSGQRFLSDGVAIAVRADEATSAPKREKQEKQEQPFVGGPR